VPAHIRDLSEVAQVAHLGIPWAERLARVGVRDRGQLIAADPDSLWERLSSTEEGAPERALVRLWVRKASKSR